MIGIVFLLGTAGFCLSLFVLFLFLFSGLRLTVLLVTLLVFFLLFRRVLCLIRLLFMLTRLLFILIRLLLFILLGTGLFVLFLLIR